MRTLMKKDLQDQQRFQEMEILLAHDFEKMDLKQLQQVEKRYLNLVKDGSLSWNSEQYKAWQFMYLRIKEEENKNDTVKVGDLFYSSWGYDQTNTEFYKIISISKTGKTCKVVQVGAESIGDKKEIARNMSDSAVPDPENIIDTRKQLVKIERQYQKNPWTLKSVQVGEKQLRGSVFISGDECSSKHLTTLYRVKGSCSRSWYA